MSITGPSKRAFIVALLITLGIMAQVASRPWSSPIIWDAFGYHLYLPLTFVHHDLGMQDPSIVEGIIERYKPSDTFYQAHKAPTGNMVIRYTPGLAVIQLPGFLFAHALAEGMGYPADGLSKPYQVAVFITCMLFLFTGLVCLHLFLDSNFGSTVASFTTVLIIFGTNAMDQLVDQQLMTHNYSFALYAVLLWATQRLHQRINVQRSLLVGLVLGLLIIVRPTNGLALLIPVLWPLEGHSFIGKWRTLFKQHKLKLFILVVSMSAVSLILLGYWKIYAGSWLYDSYQNPGEGLDIFYPHLHKFLFSFQKGWFVYTPIMLVAVFGLFRLWRTRWKATLAITVFLVIFIFIVSSWTLWYYPGGFGQRAAVDIYPLMAVGLASVLQWALRATGALRFFVVSVLVLVGALNLFQIVQLRRGVHEPDRMTASYYFGTFFDLEPDAAKRSMLLFKRPTTANAQLDDLNNYTVFGEWQQPVPITPDQVAPDGKPAFFLDAEHPFTTAFELEYQDLTPNDHAWVEVSGRIYADTLIGETDASLVATMDHDGSYGYQAVDVKGFPNMIPGQWNEFSFNYLTPVARRPWDILKVYGWFRNGRAIWLDGLRVKSLVRKPADVPRKSGPHAGWNGPSTGASRIADMECGILAQRVPGHVNRRVK